MEETISKRMYRKKMIVASPVYQKPAILKVFLTSLKELNYGMDAPDFIFADDNVDEESKQLLADFSREGSEIVILHGKDQTFYVCDEESHHWDDNLMFKVAQYKNKMIQYAIDYNYDELFFVDSDLVLHPDLIIHLRHRQKEVVSEIFWSQWHEGQPMEPNVWLFDEYDLVPKQLGEELSVAEKAERQSDFIEMLKKPGIYEVGGLGACTLISRSALLKGVNFSPVKNLTIHGEDRFFCIRAAVLGIGLFVDTQYPAYHIYREPDLAGVDEFIRKGQTTRMKNKITLSMTVRNEGGRYLERMLQSVAGHIDNAVIIDDASTDSTAEMCRTLLKGIPLTLISNEKSMFSNEIDLRKKQWEETINMNPDWILNLDADEIPEEGFWEDAQEIMDDPEAGCCRFHLYDMWNDTAYREDDFWNAHKRSSIFLLRYQPDFSYKWLETPQHCGRFPMNCGDDKKAGKEYCIQHWGWSTAEDRERKYKRYQQLDPGAVYGNKEQYESIQDRKPNLIEWADRQ